MDFISKYILKIAQRASPVGVASQMPLFPRKIGRIAKGTMTNKIDLLREITTDSMGFPMAV